MGRALSPGHSTERTRKRRVRKKHGGYDEDSESDDGDDGDDDSFGPSALKAKLGSNEISEDAKKYFSKDFGLRVLHLGSAMQDAESVAQFLHGLGQSCPVRELSLTSNNIGPEGAKALAPSLGQLKQLNELLLRGV